MHLPKPRLACLSICALLFACLVSPLLGTGQPQTPIAFRYAKNISVETFPTYRLFTVRNINRESKDEFRYALVPKDQPLPELSKGTIVVRTPVERIVVMSTTFVGYLDALDRIDLIVGAATPEFINNEAVRQRVKDGQVQTVQTGQSLDMESMLLLQPDLILASSSGNPRFDIHPQLARSGLPVVVSAAYMEAHPLARSEWIKFIGAFLQLEAEANDTFDAIAERYNALAQQTKLLTNHPTVFTNAPYSGSWHVSGGRSYSAKAIADAGGQYLWADDDSSGAIPLDFERVFIKAANADFWLNPSSYCSLDALFSSDQRFQKFKAARTHQIYNNCKQLNENGGNNVWERGIVHPDEVLADLIQILHPELIEDRELIFYQQLQ